MTEQSMRRICANILEKITPNEDEAKRVRSLAEATRMRISEALKAAGLKADVKIEGSFAKDTWLSGEADVDIFILHPMDVDQKVVEETSLLISRETLESWNQASGISERYAEHPYIEVFIDGVRVNVVPGYGVKRGEWVTAVDRTPFHTEYVRSKLRFKEELDEVRLLKKFMKGVGVYGAEIKTRGFSGYLCELLTICYQDFLSVLKGASKWRVGQVVDIEGYYKGRLNEAREIFNAPLIVIDPVDERRNAAAAVSIDRFKEFIAASRIFLEKPRETFFYPPKVKLASDEELKGILSTRGADLVFVVFDKVDIVPDVLWGQLYKSIESLSNMVRQHDFKVIRTFCWSDEKSVNVFLFEVENSILSSSKKHIGPPVEAKESNDFVEKHAGAQHVVCGPWIENGRWVYEVRRRYTDLTKLLQEKLIDGGRGVGVANKLVTSIKSSMKVFRNMEIMQLYRENKEFAKAFMEFLLGKPAWLDFR